MMWVQLRLILPCRSALAAGFGWPLGAAFVKGGRVFWICDALELGKDRSVRRNDAFLLLDRVCYACDYINNLSVQSMAKLKVAFGGVESLAFLKKIANPGAGLPGSLGIGTESSDILNALRVRLVDRGIIPVPRLVAGFTKLQHLRFDGLKLFKLFCVLYGIVIDACPRWRQGVR